MAWSTSELAELAGTTVNTIRHYHRLGLIDQPERRHNGYKQYGVHDLIRLLRIRRLAELGVPLSRIAELDPDGDIAPEALREVDAGLAAEIERLRVARSAIATILRDGAPAHASRSSTFDDALLRVYAQFYDQNAMADLRCLVEAGTDGVDEDIDALPADADEATRQSLAELLAPALARHLTDYPWLSDPAGHLSNSEHVTEQTFVDAVVELYNAAQLDVLGRAIVLAHEHPRH